MWNKMKLRVLSKRLAAITEKVDDNRCPEQEHIDSAIEAIGHQLQELEWLYEKGLKEYERDLAMRRWCDPNYPDL